MTPKGVLLKAQLVNEQKMLQIPTNHIGKRKMSIEIQEVRLKTYPAYKDSGVEWLGGIKCQSFKAVVIFSDQQNDE